MMIKRTILTVFVAVFCLSYSYGNEATNDVGVVQLLTNSMDLPSGGGYLLTIPGMGLIYCDEGVLFPLDTIKCPDIENVYLKQNVYYDDIISSDGRLFVKSGNSVLLLDQENTHAVVQFDTDFFQLYSGCNNHLNVAVLEDNGYWVWYEISILNYELSSKLAFSKPIIKIIDVGSSVICVTEDIIYIYDGEQLIEYVESSDIIIDAIFTSEGLFFCTDNALYLVDNNGEMSSLAELPMFSLYHDEGTVYIVLQNGDIYRMSLY